MLKPANIKHFYIPDEQSIYFTVTLRMRKKLKDWFQLCTEQLQLLGYQNIELIGKGAFGFAFAGTVSNNNNSVHGSKFQQQVFKFSRINQPQHIQDRFEEEAYMLSLVKHHNVPQLIEYQRIKKQSILVMQRAKGDDLEKISLKYGPLSVRLVMNIAVQLADVLLYLRTYQQQGHVKPIVHGDIKPSNIVLDESNNKIGLIDWGSSVFCAN